MREIKFDVMLNDRFVCTLCMKLTPPQYQRVDRSDAGTKTKGNTKIHRTEAALAER
jgi:hypothetical protein